ncbi:MAG: FAD-binding oxidoreductase [Alphaproteobacteria bacterium]
MSIAAPGPVDRASVDWAEVKVALGAIPVIDEPALVKQKSRDFYWYSPILKQQLRKVAGDLVVRPRDEADVIAFAREAVRRRLPVTVRGAGTGNYGQAMPLKGGVVLEMMGMNRLLDSGPGWARVAPGMKLIDLDAALRPTGWEMRFHPSTKRTASIGGFIAGGSSGVGSITYGILRERGNVIAARVVTFEDEPRVLEFRGDAVDRVNHAYGTNGIITELTIATAPAYDWHDIVVTFADFDAATAFAQALARSDGIVKKLVTVVAPPLGQDYFRTLADVLAPGHTAVLLMIGAPSLIAFADLMAEHAGQEVYRASPEQAARTVPLYEYSWNHTTLWGLKVDKSITYLQVLYPPPDHLALVRKMRAAFGDEVPLHLEFVRFGGEVTCFGLPVVRYSTPERLAEIIAFHEANGCPIFNPHDYTLEGGGMKKVDAVQLAFKREADPYGLLNPGKMVAWDDPGHQEDEGRTYLYER